MPGQFGADAPELAQRGSYAVGFRTLHLVDRAQVDLLHYAPSTSAPVRADRALEVLLWYPARPTKHGAVVVYTASLPGEPPAGAAQFSFPGFARRDVLPLEQRFPLVVVSHGYSNDPLLMTWLTENLASKGYVVAAIRHADPAITDRSQFKQVLLRRPLDIAFVVGALQSMLAAQQLIDPERVALVGYSMGGYGVLSAAGAVFDPQSPVVTGLVPDGLMLPYARGGAQQSSLLVRSLRAVVAISPAGGGPTLGAWGSDGLQGISAPLLLIAGDVDRTVNYQSGARAFFDAATHSSRYLLTFHLAGHALGLNPVPDTMRQRLWDQDWFEDPVWRKDRINAINVHFITAFLDRYVKDQVSRAAYLDVPVPDSTQGSWPATQPPGQYDSVSPGNTGPGDAAVTLWKGFQRNHATGLELLHAGE